MKLCSLIFLSFLSHDLQAQAVEDHSSGETDFVINGRLGSANAHTYIYLNYYTGTTHHRDSALVDNHNFHFRGKISEPVKAELNEPGLPGSPYWQQKHRWISIYLEPGTIRVNGDSLYTARVEGGERQSDLNELNGQLAEVRAQREADVEKIEAALPADRPALFPAMRALGLRERAIEEAWQQAHPDSYLSLDLLIGVSNPIYDLEALQQKFETLSGRVRKSPAAMRLADLLAKAQETRVGVSAREIAEPDMYGRLFNLSSLRGKYVLVDFWASWCGGCRSQIKDLKKTYALYKDKGFRVVAVSLDHVKKAWLDAIKEDGASWIQVSDLKGADNAAAKDYGIHGVPQNFLIDQNGKIIGRNLGVEELEKRLFSLFK